MNVIVMKTAGRKDAILEDRILGILLYPIKKMKNQVDAMARFNVY